MQKATVAYLFKNKYNVGLLKINKISNTHRAHARALFKMSVICEPNLILLSIYRTTFFLHVFKHLNGHNSPTLCKFTNFYT